MKFGDIVRPSNKWIDQERNAAVLRSPVSLLEDRSSYFEARKARFEYLEKNCFGIIDSFGPRTGFSVNWLTKAPVHAYNPHYAWWDEDELEVVEASDPIWEKYKTR